MKVLFLKNKFIFVIIHFFSIKELATLYKQCPGDREIEEYTKRIHALRQRMVEADIHVKIIQVKKTSLFYLGYIMLACFHLGSCR